MFKKIKEYLGNGHYVTRLVKFYAQEWGNELQPLAESPLEKQLNTPFFTLPEGISIQDYKGEDKEAIDMFKQIPREVMPEIYFTFPEGVGAMDSETIERLIKELKERR
jgi:hypothetical protein